MRLYSWGLKVEQGEASKIDVILEDKIGYRLQKVLLLVEVVRDLEDTTVEEATEIDLNLLIGTDFEEDLTPEEEEMIVIDSDYLENSLNYQMSLQGL